MTIEYRKAEYGDFDIEAVVGIARAIRPDSFESLAEHVEWHEVQRRAGNLCDRWLVSVDGRVVGSAYVGQSSVYALPPEVITIYVAVHPDYQRQGYGRELTKRAEFTASEHNREKAYSYADETQLRSVRVAERAGYREIDRGWESTLDLTQSDLNGLRGAVARLGSNGIRVASAAALALERENWKQELHHLYVTVESDVPAPFPINGVPIEVFEIQNLGRQLVGDGFLVALDGEQFVGLTEMRLVEDAPREASQRLTGVHPDYRGRGIAVALKSQAVIWAAEAGFTSIRTHNAQSNGPMLAINDQLGFERNHATIVYLKDL
jgi:GNAT superfamily N-acetyltransferase